VQANEASLWMLRSTFSQSKSIYISLTT